MSRRPSIFMGGSNASTEAQARINYGLGPANNVVHESVIANTVGISISGILVGDGRYSNINFTGSGVAAVLDNNFGNVNVVISGGGVSSIDDGTATDPGFIYTTEADMGLWKPSVNTIGFATAGVSRWVITTSELKPVGNLTQGIGSVSAMPSTSFLANVRFGGGSAAGPPISFHSDTNLGLYRAAADKLGITTGGTGRWLFTDSNLAPVANAVYDLGTITELISNVYTQSLKLGSGVGSGTITGNVQITGNLSLPDGSATVPSLTYTNDLNTGLFRSNPDEISITTGGITRITYSDTTVEFNELLLQNAELKDFSITSNIIPAISAEQNLYLEYNEGPDFQVTLDTDVANVQVNNWPATGILGKITVEFKQDGSGGNFVDFIGTNTDTKFEANVFPVMPTGANQDLEVVIWSRNAGANVKIHEIGQIFLR